MMDYERKELTRVWYQFHFKEIPNNGLMLPF